MNIRPPPNFKPTRFECTQIVLSMVMENVGVKALDFNDFKALKLCKLPSRLNQALLVV